jgi:serine/threonine-protein kinase
VSDLLRDQLARSLGTAYVIERELGGGGMSRVFLAEETRFHRSVVIKVLSPELAAALSAERFEREISLAAALQEPHIVPVLTAGTLDDGLPFYTMPWVEGESLRMRLDRGPLPLGEATSILRDVARALAYAHARGIVHRDVKPANVLLSSGTAVVTDFGIAKALAASRTRAPGGTLTQIGTSLGTPAYMAPEQAAGDPATDHRADIYAWGVMAYEILAGVHPFANRTSPQQLMAAHFGETPESLATPRFAVPKPIAAIVMRSLAKDPDQRPGSAAELVSALEQAVAAAPDRATMRRRRISLAVGAAATLALVAGLAWRARSSQPSATPLIAVLPFETEGPAPDSGFAGGLADAVAGKLSRLSALRVMDRGSVLASRGTAQTPAQWGRALGADYVLRATIRWTRGADGQVRAQLMPVLVRVSDGTARWSGEPEVVSVADPFAVQAQLASHVVDALDVALAPAERVQLAAAPTRDTAAYGAFVRGTQLLRDASSGSAIPQLRQAYAEFARAYQRDPRFADAYGQGARTAMLLAEGGAPGAYVDSGRALAQKALALDSTQAAAVGVMAGVFRMNGDPAAARALIERAALANPSNVRLLGLAANAAGQRGDTAQAWDLVQRVVRLAPRSADALASIAQSAAYAGRFGESLDLIDRAERLEPQRTDVLLMDVYASLYVGDSARAARALSRYRERGGRPTTTALFLMHIGDAATRREAANGSLATFGVTTALDSMEFYVARAQLFMKMGDMRRARELVDSGWAVATRPRDAASLAKSCKRCMAGQRAWMAAFRGDSVAAFAAIRSAMDSAAMRQWPDGVEAAGIECYRAEMRALLNDVNGLVADLRRCVSHPSSPPPESFALQPSFAKWMGDARVREAISGGRGRKLDVRRVE